MSFFLLADTAGRQLQSFSHRFQYADHSWFGALCVVSLLVLLASIAAMYLARRRQELREQLDDPHLLFIELVRAHQLSSEERSELVKLAEQVECAPDQLFVRPDLFDAAAHATLCVPGADLSVANRLRSILFKDSPQADTPAAANPGLHVAT